MHLIKFSNPQSIEMLAKVRLERGCALLFNSISICGISSTDTGCLLKLLAFEAPQDDPSSDRTSC